VTSKAEYKSRCLLVWLFATCAIALTTGIGCGRGQALCGVSGTVTLGTELLDEASINFYSPSTGAGVIAAVSSGVFSVQGKLRPGDYRVTILPKASPPPIPGESRPPAPKARIPVKYQDERTSGLRFTLQEGRNTVEIRLE
jgi:hypothetical protein